jgi:pyruvate kinase
MSFTQYHYGKVGTTIIPAISKETIISKMINFVDFFKINLSHGYDDSKKKYIDTINKLDNSKTIMIEIKGAEIRTKNAKDIVVKKSQSLTIDFSEYFDDQDGTLFIDYLHISDIVPDTTIAFEDCPVVLKVICVDNQKAECKVMTGWQIVSNKLVHFENYVPKLDFVTERDKKDINRWLQVGINFFILSYVRNEDNIREVKQFVKDTTDKDIVAYCKIDTLDGINNMENIIKTADGVFVDLIALNELDDTVKPKHIMKLASFYGKPVIISIDYTQVKAKNFQKMIHEYIKYGVAAFLVSSGDLTWDEIVENLMQTHDVLWTISREISVTSVQSDMYMSVDDYLTDYIIFSSYQMYQDLSARAIICYTDDGSIASKLASLKPNIPIIAFTKTDVTYRYLNMMWGVKSYKIAASFDYENIKKIGKEVIRVIFKWNITLDDKIIFVHASNTNTHQQNHMINGIEIYKFKEI